jgi:hypothetical protein
MAPGGSYKARLHLSVAKLTELGLPTFQTKPDKSPATKRGFKDALVDSEQVQRWRDHAMAAMPTGIRPNRRKATSPRRMKTGIERRTAILGVQNISAAEENGSRSVARPSATAIAFDFQR